MSLIEDVEDLIAQCVPTDALNSAWIRQSAEEIISLVAKTILDSMDEYPSRYSLILEMVNHPEDF